MTSVIAELIGKVVTAILSSPSPVEAAKRALVAAGSERASEEILKRRLGG